MGEERRRVDEERRRASELRPCEADDSLGVLERVGNYLGSWVGLSPVSEHEGGLVMPHKISSCTLKLSVWMSHSPRIGWELS